MSRATQSRRPRGASGRAGCPSPTSSRRALGAALPSIRRDRDQLVERGVELLLARADEALAQDRDELPLRAAGDEDDEAEAEALLVGAVQLGELGRCGVRALLGGRARRARRPADRGVGVEHLLLLGVDQLRGDRARVAERIVERRESLDEGGAPLEQRRELLDAQLPR